ncbi:hypothetical protein [Bradyrhizobium japonicum]
MQQGNHCSRCEELRVFATEEAAKVWLDENDPEGVAFEYDVLSLEAANAPVRGILLDDLLLARWLGFEFANPAIQMPELHVMTVHEIFNLFFFRLVPSRGFGSSCSA